MKLRIPIPPVPASRPRVTRWGTYHTPRYKAWLKAAGQILNGAKQPIEGPVRVDIETIIERAKTSKLTIPVGDADNYAKGVLDVLTHKGYWHDDKQVVELFVSKRFALPGEAPGTNIEIRRL